MSILIKCTGKKVTLKVLKILANTAGVGIGADPQFKSGSLDYFLSITSFYLMRETRNTISKTLVVGETL